jgi:hypothetical protein
MRWWDTQHVRTRCTSAHLLASSCFGAFAPSLVKHKDRSRHLQMSDYNRLNRFCRRRRRRMRTPANAATAQAQGPCIDPGPYQSINAQVPYAMLRRRNEEADALCRRRCAAGGRCLPAAAQLEPLKYSRDQRLSFTHRRGAKAGPWRMRVRPMVPRRFVTAPGGLQAPAAASAGCLPLGGGSIARAASVDRSPTTAVRRRRMRS